MSLWDSVTGSLAQILPTSPFAPYIDQFAALPYLGQLNWFFPIREALVVLASWVGVITVFYLYSVVLRWVKIIGD